MTYPPTNPGYPASPQPGGYGVAGSAPGLPPYPAARPSRMPAFLAVAVVVLGLAAFFASFGPLLVINTDIGPFGGAEFTASGLSYWTVAALVAALLGAVGLLPRSADYTPIVAVAAVLGVLLVIAQLINRPSGFAVGWALWLVLLFTAGQAIAAVTALLFRAGVVTAAPSRARYGQYGPPPSSYYPGVPGPSGAQRPGYPTPYAGYPPYGGGGFPAAEPSGGPDTPPTGFPSYTPVPPADSGHGAEQAPGSAPGSTQS